MTADGWPPDAVETKDLHVLSWEMVEVETDRILQQLEEVTGCWPETIVYLAIWDLFHGTDEVRDYLGLQPGQPAKSLIEGTL